MFGLKDIAKTMAVVAFGTAAQAQDDVQLPEPTGTYSAVADTKLNNCITEALSGEEGTFRSYRYEDGGRITENFTVNASPAADQGHVIGTLVSLDGTVEEGIKYMQIRGLHDGTVENDNGASAIDFVITPDPNNVSEPANAIMVNGDKPGDKPLGDVEAVKANTIRVLNDIRSCMKLGM